MSTTLGKHCDLSSRDCGAGEECGTDAVCTCSLARGLLLNADATECETSPVGWWLVFFSVIMFAVFIILTIRSVVALRIVVARREKSKGSSSMGIAALVTTVTCMGFCICTILLIAGNVLFATKVERGYWTSMELYVVAACVFFIVIAQMSIALVWMEIITAARKMQKASFRKSATIASGIIFAAAFIGFDLSGNFDLNQLLTAVYAAAIGWIMWAYSKKLARLVMGSNAKPKVTTAPREGADNGIGASVASAQSTSPKMTEVQKDLAESERILLAGRRMKLSSIIYITGVVVLLIGGMMKDGSLLASFLSATFYLCLYLCFWVDALVITSYIGDGRAKGVLSPSWVMVAGVVGLNGRMKIFSYFCVLRSGKVAPGKECISEQRSLDGTGHPSPRQLVKIVTMADLTGDRLSEGGQITQQIIPRSSIGLAEDETTVPIAPLPPV